MNNEVAKNCSIDSAKNLCFFIEENNKKTLIYKIPKKRKEVWERPYYFEIKKRNLIRFIKSNI